MGHILQRLGFRITRGWALLLSVTGATVALMLWAGPPQTETGQLQLVAIASDSASTTVEAVGVTDSLTQATRFVIVPAVRNVGARTARPRQLILSVPSQFAVATMAGAVPVDVSPGVPLRRYIINLPVVNVPADSSLRRLPGLDSLFIVPQLASWYCVMGDDGVPEFMPAPAFDPSALDQIRIFYSMRTGRGDERHSGLLNVQLDPEPLRVEQPPMPPAFPTEIVEPEAPRPALGVLHYTGGRQVHCGDPEVPIELYSVLYETEERSRFFVIFVDGVARKRLYDLNGDGIIELETWDAQGDGLFEGRREARFPTPDFLLPPPRRMAELLEPDESDPDTLWVALFDRPEMGLRRFRTTPLRPAALPLDTPRVRTTRDTTTIVIAPEDTANARVVDPQFLALFDDVDRGPGRFAGLPPLHAPRSRIAAPAAVPEPSAEPGAESIEPASPQAPAQRAATPPPAERTPAARPPAAEPQRAEPPAPRPEPRPETRPPAREPIGTPVPTPPIRRDTLQLSLDPRRG